MLMNIKESKRKRESLTQNNKPTVRYHGIKRQWNRIVHFR